MCQSGVADQAGLPLPAYQSRSSPKLKASPIMASCRSYDHYADSGLAAFPCREHPNPDKAVFPTDIGLEEP
jgi:hypothetical protein